MRYKTVSVDVDVDLDDFDDDDLIDIIEDRGYTVFKGDVQSDEVIANIEKLFQQYRTGQDYQKALNELFYNALGKIV